jgi:hypothetical protein
MEDQKNDDALSKRLKKAYKRIPFSLRSKFRDSFCEVHSIAEGTFYHKLAGRNAVTEMECEYAEKYKPYPVPVTA